jgi:tRNA G18 (ribose-2'-O)-methylase SpoU
VANAWGVHEAWNHLARSAVAIPMVGMIDSLNAATALAVTLWESHRRRSTPDGRRA